MSTINNDFDGFILINGEANAQPEEITSATTDAPGYAASLLTQVATFARAVFTKINAAMNDTSNPEGIRNAYANENFRTGPM